LDISKTILHPYALLDLIVSGWCEGSPSLSVLVGTIVSDYVSIGNDPRFHHGNSGMGAWDLYYVKANLFAENQFPAFGPHVSIVGVGLAHGIVKP
jgi:hypothetical protein